MEEKSGLVVQSNFACRPLESVEELLVSPQLKSALCEIVPSLTPALRYGLPIVSQPESLYLTLPSGTYTSVLSIVGLVHLIDPAMKFLQGLVVIPRKDLIAEYIDRFSKFNSTKISCIKCIGGEYFNKKTLRTAQLVICTPGKLLSLLESGELNLDYLKIVTFDVCNGLFFRDLKPQSEKALSLLPNSAIFWFLSPVADEVSKELFLLKIPDGKTVDLIDERVLKQVEFFFKVYEFEEDIFVYLEDRCERFEGQIVVFSVNSEEIQRVVKRIKRFGPAEMLEEMGLEEQIRVREEVSQGKYKVVVCFGTFGFVRKVICKEIAEVVVLDVVNADMLVARARRGGFKSGDRVVMFCKEYEREDILRLGVEAKVEIREIFRD